VGLYVPLLEFNLIDRFAAGVKLLRVRTFGFLEASLERFARRTDRPAVRSA